MGVTVFTGAVALGSGAGVLVGIVFEGVRVTIVFEFEDAVGEKHSVEKTFSFEAFPMEQPEENWPPEGIEGGGDYPIGEEDQGFSFLPVIIVIGLIGIIVIVVIKRKIRELTLSDFFFRNHGPPG